MTSRVYFVYDISSQVFLIFLCSPDLACADVLVTRAEGRHVHALTAGHFTEHCQGSLVSGSFCLNNIRGPCNFSCYLIMVRHFLPGLIAVKMIA